jgi:hypothetical protein
VDEFARLSIHLAVKRGFYIKSNVPALPWLLEFYGLQWLYVATAVRVMIVTAYAAIFIVANVVFIDVGAINQTTIPALF